MPTRKEVEPLWYVEMVEQRNAAGDLGLKVLPAHPDDRRNPDATHVGLRCAQLPEGIVIPMLRHLLHVVALGMGLRVGLALGIPQPIRAFMPLVESAG